MCRPSVAICLLISLGIGRFARRLGLPATTAPTRAEGQSPAGPRRDPCCDHVDLADPTQTFHTGDELRVDDGYSIY
ncbi:hypothetical protein BH23ACT2_BH23ACT2_21560 [soil metagenome]